MVDRERRAVFEADLRGAERRAIAFGHDDDRRGAAGPFADRAADGRDRFRRRRAAPAEGVEVVGLNLVGDVLISDAILFRSTRDHAWTCVRPPASISGPSSSSDM